MDKDIVNLKRQEDTPGAVYTTDVSGLAAYKKARMYKLEERRKIQQMESDVAEIKEMMQLILEKLK